MVWFRGKSFRGQSKIALKTIHYPAQQALYEPSARRTRHLAHDEGRRKNMLYFFSSSRLALGAKCRVRLAWLLKLLLCRLTIRWRFSVFFSFVILRVNEQFQGWTKLALYQRYFIETTVLSMEEGHTSLKPNLPELFKMSEYAKIIQQTTKPILEEFSTSLRSVGFSKEKEITYATSFCSQVCSF